MRCFGLLLTEVHITFTMFLLFLSDEGWLHKAVEIEGQLHIIEELQLFEKPQPVNNLLLSEKQVVCLTITRTFNE